MGIGDDTLGRENQGPDPEQISDYAGIVTISQIEELGRLADTADSLVGASQLAMPPAFHVTQLRNGLRSISQQIKALYEAIYGVNPWEDVPVGSSDLTSAPE